MKKHYNKAGALISMAGYVICTVCGKENQDISKETEPAYAMHRSCTPAYKAKALAKQTGIYTGDIEE